MYEIIIDMKCLVDDTNLKLQEYQGLYVYKCNECKAVILTAKDVAAFKYNFNTTLLPKSRYRNAFESASN
jgi:hypothetical protein